MKNHLIVNSNHVEDFDLQEEKFCGEGKAGGKLKHNTYMQAESFQKKTQKTQCSTVKSILFKLILSKNTNSGI